jgi:heme-degrading monooxygenase HmoA
MIARHWRGWTTLQNGDAYEHHLKGKVLPELKKLAGYRGMHILRRNLADEVEFVVINLFDSITDVKAFAGEDYSAAKFEPEARQLLAKVEPLAYHYQFYGSIF